MPVRTITFASSWAGTEVVELTNDRHQCPVRTNLALMTQFRPETVRSRSDRPIPGVSEARSVRQKTSFGQIWDDHRVRGELFQNGWFVRASQPCHSIGVCTYPPLPLQGPGHRPPNAPLGIEHLVLILLDGLQPSQHSERLEGVDPHGYPLLNISERLTFQGIHLTPASLAASGSILSSCCLAS